jgi:hypothetical protein
VVCRDAGRATIVVSRDKHASRAKLEAANGIDCKKHLQFVAPRDLYVTAPPILLSSTSTPCIVPVTSCGTRRSLNGRGIGQQTTSAR